MYESYLSNKQKYTALNSAMMGTDIPHAPTENHAPGNNTNLQNKTSGTELDDSEYIILRGYEKSQESEPKVLSLGSFTVHDQVVIGDLIYEIVDMKKGLYHTYLVNDNLVIVHDDLKLNLTDPIILKQIYTWKWKFSGHEAGVDTGNYGFYDLFAIKKIKEFVNSLPYAIEKKGPISVAGIARPNVIHDGGAQTVGIGDLELNIFKGYDVSDADMDRLYYTMPEPFGVTTTTHVGDGGFGCYTIGNDRAFLIGGLTAEAMP